MSRQASGLKAWFVQRLTALYIAGYFIFALFWLLLNNPISFTSWQTTLGNVPSAIFLLAFIASVLLHAWVGIRDVVIDYIHPIVPRLTILSLVALMLVVSMVWATFILILSQVAA